MVEKNTKTKTNSVALPKGVRERNAIRSQEFRKFGLEPHFYKDSDLELLKKFLLMDSAGVSMAKLAFDGFENSFTFHPNVNIAPVPVESRVRDIDKYGFFRMDAMQTHLRPNMRNTVSCHRPYQGCRAPHGQLGYIVNPFWASYGIYQSTDSTSEVEYFTGIESVDVIMSQVSKTMPNLIASVNVMIGVDELGQPCVVMSKIYSPNLNLYPAQRLVEYFTNQGYSVTIPEAYTKYYGYGRDAKTPRTVSCGKFKPRITVGAYDWNLGNTATNYIPYRHPDISFPLLTESGLGFESHACVQIKLHDSVYGKKYKEFNIPVNQEPAIECIGQKVSREHHNASCEATHDLVEMGTSRACTYKGKYFLTDYADLTLVGKCVSRDSLKRNFETLAEVGVGEYAVENMYIGVADRVFEERGRPRLRRNFEGMFDRWQVAYAYAHEPVEPVAPVAPEPMAEVAVDFGAVEREFLEGFEAPVNELVE